MIGQLQNAARQNGDLYFRRTGIRIMTMIIRYQFGLNFFRERHDVCFPFLRLWRQKSPHFAGLHAYSLSPTRVRGGNREAGPVTGKNYTRKTNHSLGANCITENVTLGSIVASGEMLLSDRRKSQSEEQHDEPKK
jgi:hypothetical protein